MPGDTQICVHTDTFFFAETFLDARLGGAHSIQLDAVSNYTNWASDSVASMAFP